MANLSIIRNLCKEKGITLSKLAIDLDITFSGLQSLLAKNTTRIDTLEKIAAYLKVPISTFFPDDPSAIIYFDESDRKMIETEIKANGLDQYKNEILSALNFIGTDIKGKFIDLDNNNSSISKEGIINEVIFRYVMKLHNEKELESLRKQLVDKEQIIELMSEKLKSLKDKSTK